MKEISFEIVPTYTCQYCRKEFERNGDVLIIQNIQPLCSDSCRFEVIKRTLTRYNNSQLKEALSVSLPKFKPKKRSEAIKRLATLTLIKMQEARA